MLAALLVGFVVLLLLAWRLAPRGVAWASDLERLNPGAGKRAEWMAPPAVQRAVKRDYLAAQAWLEECAADWGLLARELDRYTAGAYLKRQRAALGLLAQTRGPRFAAVLSTDHLLQVRHFTSDGLRCLLIDRQTARTGRTRGYWTGQPAGAQRLPDATLVVQMLYDVRQRRWLIERLIQTLPTPAPGLRVTLTADLPAPAGRDY
jgi:hypothetical protein